MKRKPFTLFGIEHTEALCPRCRDNHEHLRRETLMPVPAGMAAPLSHERQHRYTCFDCASADGLVSMMQRQRAGDERDQKQWWVMMRIAVGNDRQEKLRLPGARIGYPSVKLCAPDDFEALTEWQERCVPGYMGSDSAEPT